MLRHLPFNQCNLIVRISVASSQPEGYTTKDASGALVLGKLLWNARRLAVLGRAAQGDYETAEPTKYQGADNTQQYATPCPTAAEHILDSAVKAPPLLDELGNHDILALRRCNRALLEAMSKRLLELQLHDPLTELLSDAHHCPLSDTGPLVFSLLDQPACTLSIRELFEAKLSLLEKNTNQLEPLYRSQGGGPTGALLIFGPKLWPASYHVAIRKLEYRAHKRTAAKSASRRTLDSLNLR